MSQHMYSSHGWRNPHTPVPIPAKIWRWFRKTTLGKNLGLLVIFFLVLFSLFGLILMAFASKNLPSPDSLTARKISQATKIYDRTGEHLLYEVSGDQNRTLKKMQIGFCGDDPELSRDPDGIPLFAVQATISAEDRKFCEHGGFDVKGIVRAAFQNLLGNRVGGSTLTQQLVKNAILSREKTLTRKVKELILAIELEKKYSKDEILQIYFNEIPYGSTYYGIEAASQNYFGKTVKELTLAEAATLAALPKSPTTYLRNPDVLQVRRDYILGEMYKLGFIDVKTLENAKKQTTPVAARLTNITAPHFVLDVKAELEETYGRREVEEGGLKVTTTLDFDLQKKAEEEVLRGVEERGKQFGFSNAALVAEDVQTGHILAMVGSKDFFDKTIDGQVNVTRRLRQPGSSFKPIVYTKAFEMGYTPNTVLWDVLTEFPTVTGVYTPHNYDVKERGPLRLREALQMSLNIPAVKMITLIGVESALDFATALGYTSFSNHANFGPAVVLGGGEVRLVEHVNAYATFAREGKRLDQTSILKVEDAHGNTLLEWKPKDGREVLTPTSAKLISHVLSDNQARSPVFGLSSSLQLGDRPVAAKSGTTNDYHDAWLMGYTPQIAAGVWVGNNNNTAMKNKADGSIVAGPIWNTFMKRAHEGKPIEPFLSEEIRATGKMVLDGVIPSQHVEIDRASGKRATEFTPATFKEVRNFSEQHEILHYVNPLDPLGNPPEEPQKNPNYAAFEKGVMNWILKREKETGTKIVQTTPPVEYDDLHVPANFPSIKVISPSNNEAVADRTLSVTTSASAPRGVSRVEYYIDGLYIGSKSSSPYLLEAIIPSTVSKGIHTLKAIAYDDIDNQGVDTVNLQILSESKGLSLELVDPKNRQEIERKSETYTIVTSLKQPQTFSSLRVFVERIGTGSHMLVGEINRPTSPYLTMDWKLPEDGFYALFASAQPKDGSSAITTAGVLITISSSITSSESSFAPNGSLDPFAQ